MRRGQLSNVIRAHDTDAHVVRPFTTQVLRRDPAAGATYLADKKQGLGNVGATRTISMAQKLRETPVQTQAVVDQNLNKYQNVISNYAKTPPLQQDMNTQLDIYKQRMAEYFNNVPKVAAFPGKDLAKAISIFARKNAKSLEEILRDVISNNPNNPGAAILKKIYQLPPEERIKALEIAAKLLK